jgi:uncharacterized protein
VEFSIVSKYERKLQNWFAKHPKVLVALSGGVDSCLVAYLARKYNGKEHAISLIGISPSLKKRDLLIAESFCAEHAIAYLKIFPNEMSDANYASNPTNRCFYCKTALYKEMLDVQQKKFPGYEILNGNNYSDRGDYRPGMQAAKELDALSPLLECGLEKDVIRKLALKYKLKVWDKPASPCLSSRFPYGESITVDKLKMVEQAENYLFDLGFSDVRVRSKQSKAVVEVPFNEISHLKAAQEKIEQHLVQFGFTAVEIDAEGLVSGKLNRDITITKK